MNSRQKGDYSELLAITKATEMGFGVAIPFGNSQDYDFVILGSNNTWKSIQVKTARRRGNRGNRIYVDTIRGTSLSKKRGYKAGAFDFLIAVLPEEKEMWVLPFIEIKDRRCITIDENRDNGWCMI